VRYQIASMSGMPTLNIRNVPEQVVAALKRRAKQNGRSLNAEIVEALGVSVEAEKRRARVAKRLEEMRSEFLLPEDAPDAVELIREGREERAREIERRARGT
jgi:plasmid stability protein